MIESCDFYELWLNTFNRYCSSNTKGKTYFQFITHAKCKLLESIRYVDDRCIFKMANEYEYLFIIIEISMMGYLTMIV